MKFGINGDGKSLTDAMNELGISMSQAKKLDLLDDNNDNTIKLSVFDIAASIKQGNITQEVKNNPLFNKIQSIINNVQTTNEGDINNEIKKYGNYRVGREVKRDGVRTKTVTSNYSDGSKAVYVTHVDSSTPLGIDFDYFGYYPNGNLKFYTNSGNHMFMEIIYDENGKVLYNKGIKFNQADDNDIHNSNVNSKAISYIDENVPTKVVKDMPVTHKELTDKNSYDEITQMLGIRTPQKGISVSEPDF